MASRHERAWAAKHRGASAERKVAMNEPFSVSREASERRFRIRSLLAALAAAGLLLLLASEAWAAQFTGGPSIRVTPNVQVEFKWITDAAWVGKVEVFTNPHGTGTPVLTQ